MIELIVKDMRDLLAYTYIFNERNTHTQVYAHT